MTCFGMAGTNDGLVIVIVGGLEIFAAALSIKSCDFLSFAIDRGPRTFFSSTCTSGVESRAFWSRVERLDGVPG